VTLLALTATGPAFSLAAGSPRTAFSACGSFCGGIALRFIE